MDQKETSKHEGCVRAYNRMSWSWFAPKGEQEHIVIGMYDPKGGSSGEFTVEWVRQGDKKVARLRVYEDSWSVLSLFKDLLDKMAEIDGKEVQEPEFSQLLGSLGIIDRTAYVKESKALQQ